MIVVELHNEKGKEIVVVFDNEGPLGLHITDTTDGQVHSPTPSALSVKVAHIECTGGRHRLARTPVRA